MTVSKKQQACVSKYNAKTYEEIKVRVKKGDKATLQAAALAAGESLNSYILGAVEARMKAEQEEA